MANNPAKVPRLCGNCDNYDAPSGECRRTAPVVILITPGLNREENPVNQELGIDSVFPRIAADSWCGEFRERI